MFVSTNAAAVIAATALLKGAHAPSAVIVAAALALAAFALRGQRRW